MDDTVPDRSEAPGTTDPLSVEAIGDWLDAQGLAKTDIEPLFGGFCERLVEAGMALNRTYLGMRTLHPSVAALEYVWHRGGGVAVESFRHEVAGQSANWKASPHYYMLEADVPVLRRRLVGPDACLDFRLLEDLEAQGVTDYIATMVAFGLGGITKERTGMIASWASDDPAGFSDAEAAAIERLQPRLGLALSATLAQQVAVNLLDTYVGTSVGERILRGEIRRGFMDVIPSVILYADLQGFTTFSDRAPKDEVVAALNNFFDCMVRPVQANGGDVLKFLGDGLLAVFNVEGADPDALCGRALAAAVESLDGVARLNLDRAAAGAPVMALDVALHLGEVMFGNVGAEDRLDFTVIGPAVNEASRIEALCGEVGHNLLVSEAFAHAAASSASRLVSIGAHRLRGVGTAQELFTLDVADG